MGEAVLRALIFALTIFAVAGNADPVRAAQAGCVLKPEWLCYMNSTWWQGRSEDDAKGFILAHCRNTRHEIICNDEGRIVRLRKTQ